jgi:hypothetical protein
MFAIIILACVGLVMLDSSPVDAEDFAFYLLCVIGVGLWLLSM